MPELDGQLSPGIGGSDSGTTGGTTGRYLVLLRDTDTSAASRSLGALAGLRVAQMADFSDPAHIEEIAGGDAIMLESLGVAVVSAPPDQMMALTASAAAGDGAILAIEPERVVYAIDGGPRGESTVTVNLDYLVGYRDAAADIVNRISAGAGTALGETAGPGVAEAGATWGLQATNVIASPFTGRGVKVAVLDTGMDVGHPDFAGRNVVTASFIPGQAVTDGHGHGTHCIGTALGPRQPGQLPRYGVASEATILAGKVLSDAGSGSDGGILAGINWAVGQGAAVISMSLGAAVTPGQPFSQVFETAARRAVGAGSLIIAAAGNESRRPGHVAPAGHPANCPSIMAVAAVDVSLAIARFSCAGLSVQGGQVDIAGPGVDVRSSWPRPTLYRTISGTSMATPHVAGIAALHAEQNPAMRGGTLGWLVLRSARRLLLPSRDVGAGLVQAP